MISDHPATEFNTSLLFPGYNIPELGANELLVVDFDTIAGIYLGDITMWDDQRIKDLNPLDIQTILPHQEIRVILHKGSTATELFTIVLSKHVPRFAQQVFCYRIAYA